MKIIPILILLLSSVFSFNAQTSNSNKVKRYFYNDSIVSIEKWYDNDNKLDSAKTYHKGGQLDEQFYYLKGRYHGICTKFNFFGKKITTWNFNNGKLVERTDHIMEFNKKDEEKIKNKHAKLKELNVKIKELHGFSKYNAKRAHIRYHLGNKILALSDFNLMRKIVLKTAERKKVKPSGKSLGSIYDVLGSLYAGFKMKNHASHYKYEAIKVDPENYRLVFNLGAYLYSNESYKLAKIYLDKVLKKNPNHDFANRVLAAYYSDFEEYEKAKHHIDIAFRYEKNLLRLGYGSIERDLRTLRGFILHNLGDSENGIKDLEKAIELNKNNSYAHRNLGVVYYDLDQYELACTYLNKAKELGFGKKHCKCDLETYLDLACNHNSDQKTVLVTEDNTLAIPKLKDKPFMYPNPTKGITQVANFKYDNFDFSVYQFDGKLLKKGVSTNKSIDISNLPNGIFILKISKNGEKESFRIIKD